MSEPVPERADVRQLRIQAKELLRALQSRESHVEGIEPAAAKLADAQRLIARRYGFDSWPKLVDQLETPALIEKFKSAIEQGEPEVIEKLLRTKPALRKRINEPMFSFDAQPIFAAAHLPRAAEILPILVRYGADPNIRTKWWAGGFGVLDNARADLVDVLLGLGARFDVWSAAGHGRIDLLREMLDKNPESVHARGGDGYGPLHFAANVEVARLLIERGADLEMRDIDHEGTPIQHHIREPEVARLLLSHGAIPDIFTAVALNDPDLTRKLIATDPSAVDASVGKAPFATVNSNGGHIYAYKIGPNTTPHGLAAKLGFREEAEVLLESAPPSRRLVVAAQMGDAATVEAILSAHPDIAKNLGPDARAITDAAQEGRTETVRLLLEAGVDPKAPGLDGGSALHVACWLGYVDVVRLLVDRVPVDLVDPTHGSPPLGWACHGSHHCRNKAGDYVAVVETLLKAGADAGAPANKSGTTMLDQAGSREDVKEVLRR